MDNCEFIVLGITGNIGSGKSYVSNIISLLGIPVFDCDKEAKLIYNTDNSLKKEIVKRYGEDIYDTEGNIKKQTLASIIFSNENELKFINSIVHPAIEKELVLWINKMKQRGEKIVLIESAIMYETNLHNIVDKIILVDAQKGIRIKRAMLRDNASYDSIMSRMEKQIDNEELLKKVDFIINNSGTQLILPQLVFIFQNL